MSNDSVFLSVVICAYTQDRWSGLLDAIASVQHQSQLPSEIVLVIDHNPSLFERACQEISGVKIVENHEPQGLSGARNTGIANSSGQIIAFMDEDAVASDNWLESLLGGYSNKDVLGVGGEVRPLWATSVPGWFPEEFLWVVGCSYRGLPKTLAPVRNPIGCNMTFRKDTLQAAGGFRNGMGRIGTIPVGCEETELSIRLRQIYPGATILYQPEAVIYHQVPAWRAGWSYFIRRCFAEGLSKAMVIQYVGSNDGLSSERDYTARTLPQGVIEGIKDTFSHKDINGLKRAGAIMVGLVMTAIGFVIGRVRINRTRSGMALPDTSAITETSNQFYL